MEPFIQLLVEYAPNLENLNIHFGVELQDPVEVLKPVEKFKRLRTLSIISFYAFRLLPRFLANCPKLREISFCDLSFNSLS